MQKITTYSPDQKRSPFAFFILNRGMNSGKPLEQPCPNCFTFNAADQAEKDHNFWLCFGLWQSRSFHPHLIGSVIPFIRLHELSQVINQASEKALANPANFQKTVEALKILDRQEKQFHRNLLLITEAKKAFFANYRIRPSFYR
jgi:hypothetical protein